MLCVINTLASLLTVTALALHAVLGCCVHHYHGHPALSHSAPTAAGATHAHASSHEGHHEHGTSCGHVATTTSGDTAAPVCCPGGSGCDDRHDDQEPCGESRCHWVGTEASAKLSPGGSSLPDFPAPAPTVLTASLLLDLQPCCPGGEAGAAIATEAPRSGLALRQVWRL